MNLPKIQLGAAIQSVALTFLDCDGVIFDSNPSKTSAFEYALEGYPRDAIDRMLAHHRAFGGISRYQKLRVFFTEIQPVSDPETAIAAALVRFGERSRQAYLELRPLEGALEFSARMGGAERVFVASGADQAELNEIFDAHQILASFARVLGSPAEKQDLLAQTLAERRIESSSAILVGDGRGDFEAATSLGLPFVFLAAHSDWADGRSIVAKSRNAFVAEDWPTLLGWLR